MDVSKIPFAVEVSLGEATLTPSTLNIGDILLLDTPLEEPLQISVSGAQTLKGFPGTHQGQKAVEIVDD